MNKEQKSTPKPDHAGQDGDELTSDEIDAIVGGNDFPPPPPPPSNP
jgi:hypothetical protein